MIKAVIFDWGGTCTNGRVGENFCKTLSKKNHCSKAKLRAAFEINNKKYLLGEMQGSVFWEKFAKNVNLNMSPKQLNSLFLESGRADQKMLALIKKMKRRYKLGIISDNYKELTDFITKEYHLKKIFNVLIFSNQVKVKKPSGRIFLIALKKMGLHPKECIFIDDKRENVSAAKKIGMRALLYTDTGKLKKDLIKSGIQGL